jgi:hypothetical protein
VRHRHDDIRTEEIEFGGAKGVVTRRLGQQIGVNRQWMPTSRDAVRHGVSWARFRHAAHVFLRDAHGQRPRRRPLPLSKACGMVVGL